MKRFADPSTDEGTLRAYLREIAKLPRLSPEEEHELGIRIQRDGDEEAVRRLVESNLRFVVSYAKRYRGFSVPFLDLIHEGNLALMEAARRFDPSRNVKFITYAVWWVHQAIKEALSDQSRAFSLPSKLSAPAARLPGQLAELTSELQRSPTTKELADQLSITESEAEALMHIVGTDISLSEHIGADDDGREWEDTIAQMAVPPVEHELVHEAFVSELRQALDRLEVKERDVMRLRYGLDGEEPLTLQEIADRFKVSGERVRQIESRAKEKLRRSRKVRELRSYVDERTP
jgi:RNA polymerase primary sigma factor